MTGINGFIFVIFLSFTKLLVEDAKIEGRHLSRTFGAVYIPYRLFTLFYVLLIIYILAKKYFVFKEFKKLQIKYVLLGIGSFAIPALIINLILPGFFGIRQFNFLGPLFSIFMVGFISYAIVRHKLMDIKVVIQKGVIYTSLLTLIVGFYLASVFVLGIIFQKTTDITILFSAGLTAVLGIFGVPPIKTYFQKTTDKFFFKDKYNYSEALHKLSEALSRHIDLGKIQNEISIGLKNIFKVESVKIRFDVSALSREDNKEIKQTKSGKIVAPIVSEDKILCVIILDQKLSGDAYTEEDFRLLKTFSYHAALACERAHLYEKVKNHALELEEKVKRRTKTIQSLQEEQNQMMIDISHGLQNPLTIIKGELGFLKEQNKNSEKIGLFEKSIDEISSFIYKLLRLAKLETDEGEIKKEKINLSQMLNELVEYFIILTKEKNITVVYDIDPNIFILGDKSRLKELVVNLVSNAIKHISNERKIFIELFKNNESISLKIKDTGTGIDKEDLPNIFNRFYRAKKSEHPEIKGTGLGLAISKKIAEKHNGSIHAESVKGKETTFTIVFPL